MISALLYLQYHSIKNRTVMRFKRMKQPKYLVGAIAGGVYFYFYFFRYVFGLGSKRPGLGFMAAPENRLLMESFGSLALLVILLMAWVLPHERAALAFTEAEVAFLFPAPVSRRGLIHFKLLRSQMAILFTTLLLTLLTNRFGGHPWIRAVGWWLILSTLNLHFLGSSFGRTLLLDSGITNWQRRLGILGLVAALSVLILVWARRSMPALTFSPLEDPSGFKQYVQQALASGPALYLLYPFRLVVRPFLSTDALDFLRAVAPAVLILAVHYWWVIRSDVAFEEGSIEASKRLADKVAAMRSGNWRGTKKLRKGRRPPFPLPPLGPRPVALLWKNLISAGQGFTLRMWILLAAVGVSSCAMLSAMGGKSGWLPAVGMVAGMLMIWTLLLGPQFARQDFRQDLLLADALKTYPMRGWQIALGELLAPAVILTGIQWFLLIIATGTAALSSIGGMKTSSALGIGLSVAVIIPALNLITLQIPNAAVLLFPAWFQTGKDGAHGIEATGQRLIFMLGTLIVFALSLVPAAAVFAGVFFLVQMFLGKIAAAMIASVGAALVLAVEAGSGLLLLGWLFERFDVAAEAQS